MQSGGLSATDRKILWAIGIAFAVLGLATVLAPPPSNAGLGAIPSTYSSAPAGARAAFLLLPTLGIPAERWEEPPFRLSADSDHTTYVLAEPASMPSHGERVALRDFVNAGGRVLFCGKDLPAFFAGAQLYPAPKTPALTQPEAKLGATQYSASEPSGAAVAIELRPAAFWTHFKPGQLPVYGERNSAVVAIWTLGRGEVIWWAAATPLTNAGLNWAANLPLFLNSIGPGRRVYWDEYFHGERGSLWQYIDRTAIRWAAWQLALLAAAALFTFSRRSGPIIPERKLSRSSPLEFVETLAALYRRSQATAVAIGVALRELRLVLARRLSLSPEASAQTFATAAAERLQWDGSSLERLLNEAQTAADPATRLKPGQALALVRDMQKLSARTSAVQEKP